MLLVVFWVISQISELTFVTRRSLQFSGLLIFSFRLARGCSFNPEDRILSTMDDIFSVRGFLVCSSSNYFLNEVLDKDTLGGFRAIARALFCRWLPWLTVSYALSILFSRREVVCLPRFWLHRRQFSVLSPQGQKCSSHSLVCRSSDSTLPTPTHQSLWLFFV